jgi:SMODS-associated and fused to various effectors sensor domain
MTVTPLPRPGRTAVLITGFHYQWLLAWQGCVTVLRENAEHEPNPIVAIGVEVDGAGNLDDIVFYRLRPPHTYQQVKYAVDSSSPVNTAYLINPSDSGGPPILRKIADTFLHLTRDSLPVDLALVTNRAPDPNDPLLAGRDQRTALLMPLAGTQTAQSARGRLRAAWAKAAGHTEDQLLALLSVLRFDTARDLPHVEETTSLLMAVTGLRSDPDAVHAGADWVAQQVRNGHRRIDLSMIEKAIEQEKLRVGPTRSVLSVATLKPDPLQEQAAHALDWVDRFDGGDAYAKRRPRRPATWQQLQADIEAIPAHLGGTHQVALTGSVRQATAFAVGAALRMVTNIDLAVVQRGQLWESDTDYDAPIVPTLAEHHLGQGDEIALAIEVATSITDDVLDYLRGHRLPVDRLVVLQPPAGAKDNSVANSAAAVALAVGIRDQARRSARRHHRVHLFLAGPMGLSLLLGHRWNRVASTIIYEEIRADAQYEAAFTVSA